MADIKEYCGVFGIFNSPNAAGSIYYGLHALQHRGQESCGIVTSTFDKAKSKKVMRVYKDFGLVLDVFSNPAVFEDKLLGSSGIGHNRYSTSGSPDNRSNIQPFVVSYRDGNIAIAHNGNLSNARELRRSFSDRGTLFQTTTDSELILHLIAQSRRRKQIDQILDALSQIEGAYSVAILTDDHLIAARDPNGFKPLALGRIQSVDGNGTTAYCVASETCAFDMIKAEYVRDIEPGEVLVIDRKGCATGKFASHHLTQRYGTSQCVFEFVYFSRPDSKIFGANVDKVRRKIGKQLAHDAPVPVVKDGKKPVVIAVPDSSNTAALGFVSECIKMGLDCKYEIGFIRNHYVGRTFIAPGQDNREQRVRCKFNTVDGVLKDRVVVIVDDSIVRGTTARFLVDMVLEAGAAEVHFRVASPPVVNPCYYGMDFPDPEELLANQYERSIDAMREWLGVKSLSYLSVDGMMEAVHSSTGSKGFCNACFSGNYPVPVEHGVTKEEYD
ncbi:MAG: amidophosphoribosyltransferase [Rhodothermales bacterium]|nr:amidophosphoribosyltransferase [Rhodothermales bacterium]